MGEHLIQLAQYILGDGFVLRRCPFYPRICHRNEIAKDCFVLERGLRNEHNIIQLVDVALLPSRVFNDGILLPIDMRTVHGIELRLLFLHEKLSL